jgi:hypothetical protein
LAVPREVAHLGLNRRESLRDIERIAIDVSRIDNLLTRKRHSVESRVVRPKKTRALSNMRGAKTSTRSVAHPGIEGNPYDGHVVVFHLVTPG